MSDTTITELPLTTYILPSDYIVIDREDKTFKINVNAVSSSSSYSTIYVSPIGDDIINVGEASTSPFKTIKRAVKHANDNKNKKFIISVLNGEYLEKNPIVLPPNVSIVGENEKRVIVKPIELDYDVFWINEGSYVGGITITGHRNQAAAIAYPKFINPDILLNDITDKEYVRGYGVLGFEIDRPNQIIGGDSSPTIENLSCNTYALKTPTQNEVIQYYNNSLVSTTDSYSKFESLFNVSHSVFLNGISGSFLIEPQNNVSLPAKTEVIFYLKNKIQNYFDFDDSFSIRTFILQNFGVDLYDNSDLFFRDVNNILNSLVYDISANTNRLIVETGKTFYENISSLMIKNDNTSFTKQVVLSALRHMYNDIVYTIFEDTPLLPGNIYYFINQEFNSLINIVNGLSTVIFPLTTTPSSFLNTASLLSNNKNFITNESYGFLNSKYGVILDQEIFDYKKEIEFIIDSYIYDLNNNTNSRTIHYSSLLNQKIDSYEKLDFNLAFETFNYVGDVCKKVIQNIPISGLSVKGGDGIRLDGSLIKGGPHRTCTINDFNGIIEGGVGIWLKNNANAKILDTTLACCSVGILCEGGSTCISDGTCNMYGLSGIVALDKSPTPILSGITLNYTFSATDMVTVNSITGIPIYGITAKDTFLANSPNIGLVAEFIINNNPLSSLYLPILINPLKINTGSYELKFPENIPVNIPNNTNVNFYIRSSIIANSHTFDCVGTGTVLKKSLPNFDGVISPETEVCYDSTEIKPFGIVYYNSINQNGDVMIGKDLKISQTAKRIEGLTFNRSVLGLVTPLVIAME